MLIDKLSVRTPMGEVKLELLKEMAKEYQVEWDTLESEQELLKPPEELTKGPRNFVSTTSKPVHSVQPQSVETNEPNTSSSCITSGGGERRTSGGGERGHMQFVDSASAAEVVIKFASDATAAAQVAAYLGNKDCNQDIDIVSLKNYMAAKMLEAIIRNLKEITFREWEWQCSTYDIQVANVSIGAYAEQGMLGETKELVPGDIVETKVGGDKGAADRRVVEFISSTLRVEQGSLTGESEAVNKTNKPISEDTDIQGKKSMVFRWADCCEWELPMLGCTDRNVD